MSRSWHVINSTPFHPFHVPQGHHCSGPGPGPDPGRPDPDRPDPGRLDPDCPYHDGRPFRPSPHRRFAYRVTDQTFFGRLFVNLRFQFSVNESSCVLQCTSPRCCHCYFAYLHCHLCWTSTLHYFSRHLFLHRHPQREFYLAVRDFLRNR